MKDLAFRLAFLIFVFILLPFVMFKLINPEKTNDLLKIYDCANNKMIKMNLEDYIAAVVSAEMPAGFSDEALKAQCVAARTYALRKIDSGIPEHKGADLCTDFAHCQAYSDSDDLQKKWGNDFEKNIKKIKNAVNSTAGEYLQYDNDFALTVFHSCSNGITEKASDVWGGNVPYLNNVESSGDLKKKDYHKVYVISKDEFKTKIYGVINANSAYEQMIGNIEYTSGKNVKNIEIYGNIIKGTEIRNLFNLPSTAFEIRTENNNVIFDTYGSGHGVGMSQYGAEAMAQNGIGYREILNHYYPGTKLMKMNK